MRLLILLQSGQAWNPDALARELGVSRRTVFRDIHTLNVAGLMIWFDEVRDSYLLPSPWRLPIEPLSAAEAVSLLVVCQELGRAEGGMPFHAAAESAARKIAQGLPASLQEFAQETVQGLAIRLDPVNPLIGSAIHYETLLEAWIQRRQVRITYESASERTTISTLLSPYRMLFSRRSWYVIGRSTRDRAIRTYNIGRLLDVQLLDGVYKIPKSFRLDRHLGDAWHLIREPDQRFEVVIRFRPLVARNVAEVRWHRTQQVQWLPDGSLEFRVSVEGLTEISWWILGYGDTAEVVSPPELRERLRTRIAAMHQLYSDAQPTD